MSKKELVNCDICDSDKDVFKDQKIMVVFTTEQNEGRSVDPYLTIETIDICKECLGRIIEYRELPTASGAMGYNNYSLIRSTMKEGKHE